jgi:hypothetical protein
MADAPSLESMTIAQLTKRRAEVWNVPSHVAEVDAMILRRQLENAARAADAAQKSASAARRASWAAVGAAGAAWLTILARYMGWLP